MIAPSLYLLSLSSHSTIIIHTNTSRLNFRLLSSQNIHIDQYCSYFKICIRISELFSDILSTCNSNIIALTSIKNTVNQYLNDFHAFYASEIPQVLNKLSSQIITHAQGKQIAMWFKDFLIITPTKLIQKAFLDILLRSPLKTSPPWFCKCLKLWFRPIKRIILNLKWLSTRRSGRLCRKTA